MDPLKPLKTAVLKDEMGYLCHELGDPGRYIPSLRSKNLLDARDTEEIRGQPTSAQKVERLVDIIISRQGHSSEHPLDILINELKKQRVQVHIARQLQRTLKKKQKEAESTSSATGARPSPYEVPMSMQQQQQNKMSYERHQSHPTITAQPEPKFAPNVDFTDGQGSHTNAEPQGYQEHSYEVNPSVGLIPDAPPPLTTSYVTETSSTTTFDSEHGALPGTPPPTSNQQFTGGPGTPPRGSQPSLVEGMQYMSLNDHGGMNGDYGAGGQSSRGYSSLDTDSSMPTLSSYTTVTEASDIEKDKLRAQVQELVLLLDQEKHRSRVLEGQLSASKQELAHARQELASLKQAKIASEGVGMRQDPLVRPVTLLPMYNQDQTQRYFRQLSPARADSGGRHSMDNLSVQSANSSTSENSQQGSYSHNSSVATTPRTAQLQSYV